MTRLVAFAAVRLLRRRHEEARTAEPEPEQVAA